MQFNFDVEVVWIVKSVKSIIEINKFMFVIRGINV